jgi:hypothetical protein
MTVAESPAGTSPPQKQIDPLESRPTGALREAFQQYLKEINDLVTICDSDTEAQMEQFANHGFPQKDIVPEYQIIMQLGFPTAAISKFMYLMLCLGFQTLDYNTIMGQTVIVLGYHGATLPIFKEKSQIFAILKSKPQASGEQLNDDAETLVDDFNQVAVGDPQRNHSESQNTQELNWKTAWLWLSKIPGIETILES